MTSFPQSTAEQVQLVLNASPLQVRGRSFDEFTQLFDGLQLLSPGIVSVADWRADDALQPRPPAARVSCYGAVARKP